MNSNTLHTLRQRENMEGAIRFDVDKVLHHIKDVLKMRAEFADYCLRSHPDDARYNAAAIGVDECDKKLMQLLFINQKPLIEEK